MGLELRVRAKKPQSAGSGGAGGLLVATLGLPQLRVAANAQSYGADLIRRNGGKIDARSRWQLASPADWGRRALACDGRAARPATAPNTRKTVAPRPRQMRPLGLLLLLLLLPPLLLPLPR